MVNIGVNCVTDSVFDAAGVRSLSYFFAENSDHRALALLYSDDPAKSERQAVDFSFLKTFIFLHR